MDNINEGQKLSFSTLLTTMPNNIEIPIIQRDYAQGRKKVINIRDQFVNTLFDHLIKEEPLHLDFIYGNILSSQEKFIPLDGQQRLTTLFLLHWFTSKFENKFASFLEIIRDENGSRFTYETRQSSREFCDALVNNSFNLDNDETISEQLRNFNWYFESWDNDPTVASMLVMLDTIQKIHKERDLPELFEKLIGANELITFQFIELADHGLTDDLYIKMNARGKPLTDFENFKAKFEKILQDNPVWEKGKFLKVYHEKMDKSWTDFMWKYRDPKSNTFDKAFMNLVGTIFGISLATEETIQVDIIKDLMSGKNSNQLFDFYELNNRGSFSEVHISRFFSYLSNLISEKGNLLDPLDNNEVFSLSDFIKKTFEYNLSYSDRLQFYAYQEFLSSGKDINYLNQWMRVVRNLSENTFFREAPAFVNAVQSIKDLLTHSEDILSYLENKKEIKAFENIQKDEEYLKATLINKSNNWASKIYHLENHPYLRGQIGFFLSFTGLTQYIQAHGNGSWSDKIDNHLLEQFEKAIKLSENIFDANGITTYGNFIFRRALLTFGDFSVRKGSNWSFITNGVSREISWKSLLRESNDQLPQREVLFSLFEELDPDQDIKKQLLEIIETSTIEDYRKGFIGYPEVLRACGNNLFIRYHTKDSILLLSKNQTNGKHHEYFTYYLDCVLQDQGIKTVYQTANSIDEFKGITKINGYSCEVKWVPTSEVTDEQSTYLIRFKKEEYLTESIDKTLVKLRELSIID